MINKKLKTFEIMAHFTETSAGKVWFTVEAETKEKALELLEDPDFSEPENICTKTTHSDGFTFIFDDAEVVEELE